jgi:PST family polysaccharide transporter
VIIKKLQDLVNRFRVGDKRRVLSNFISLSVLQGTNLLLPLLTFPYLVRVLGIEKFGLISLALATVAYFEILADYGFDFSATRQISIHRDNKEKITSIYSSVLSIKVLISIGSLLILTSLIFSVCKFSEFFLVYYFTFGRVIGKSLFPVWFFEGMERMRIIMYINIIAKLIFTVAIFLFVKYENDFLLVPIFNSLGFLVVGVIAMIQIRYWFGVRFTLQSKETLLEHLKDGWHIFLSRIYVNIYTTTNTFLLGLLTNNIVVGYYSVAAKIIEAISSVFDPALTAIYPYMSKLYHDSTQKFYSLVRRLNILFLIASCILFFAAFILGDRIIVLVNGSLDNSIYAIYSILIYRILLTPFGPFFTMVLVSQNRKSQYLSIVKFTFIVNMLVVPLSIYFYAGTGMAFAVLAVSILHILLFLRHKLVPVDVH